MATRFLVIIGWGLLLGGCIAQPTPFPVTPIQTKEAATPAPEQTNGEIIPALPLLQYGILPNALDFFPYEQFKSMDIEIKPISDLSDPEKFDVMTGYGIYDGWTRAPVRITPLSIVMNTTIAPLNDPEIANVMRSVIPSSHIVEQLDISGITILAAEVDSKTTREALANMGYPDGFTIYGSVANLPGINLIIEALASANITLVVVDDEVPLANLHISIQQLDETTRQTYDQNQIIDLFTLPISYIARDNIQTTFTADGWVIATR